MSNFREHLLGIIEERENALFEIERVLFTKRYNLSQKHFNIFAVQSISMIYAIWEGFVQQACQLYITELNRQQVAFDSLSDDLIIFHLENKFKQFREYPNKDKQKIAFYANLRQFFTTKHHNVYTAVNTDSNVGFDVLNKILKNISLDPFPEFWDTTERYQSWEVKDYRINLKSALTTFLKYRNGVAHGGDISSEEKVTHDVYIKYKKLVVDLMYAIYDKMVTSFEQKRYLKQNTTTP